MDTVQNIKHCKMCGVIFYPTDEEQVFCECCLDDLDENNPYRQWERNYDNGNT